MKTEQLNFLPDFCATGSIFIVVIIGELLALVLSLPTYTAGADEFWLELAFTSLFIQWTGLGSATLLCLFKSVLVRFSDIVSGLLALLLICIITILVSISIPHLSEFYSLKVTLDAFIIKNVLISGIISAIALRYLYVQARWRIHIESESHARVQALQSRIRPHFLFNSMNTIASLTRSDPETAERVVEDLAELFRISLNDARTLTSLQEEIQLCKRYLAIEALRLGERLNVNWQIDDIPDDILIPPLLLQPIIENAVYHGIEPDPDGGQITIKLTLENNHLICTVRNTLPADDLRSHRITNNMALDNIRQRLVAVYANKAELHIDKSTDAYQVYLSLPNLKKAESSA